MKKLDDLSICKRIAEIEGVHVFNDGSELLVPDYETSLVTGYDEDKEYNPLTDDGVCFRLMIKYGVCVHHDCGDVFICGGDNSDGCLAVISFETDCDKSLKKAICLCIIEVHHDNSN